MGQKKEFIEKLPQMLISHKGRKITLKNGVISGKERVKAVPRKFLPTWSYFMSWFQFLLPVIKLKNTGTWNMSDYLLGRKRESTRPQTEYNFRMYWPQTGHLIGAKISDGPQTADSQKKKTLEFTNWIFWTIQISTFKLTTLYLKTNHHHHSQGQDHRILDTLSLIHISEPTRPY